MHRRIALSLLAVALAAVAAPAQVEVVPGVRFVRGTFTPGSQPDGNSVVFDAPEGLVVVDTGRHAAHTQAVLGYAKGAGRPIAAVVNTHWHLDHISGNAAVRAAHPGLRVYASGALEGALSGFLANSRRQLQEMLQGELPAAQRTAFEQEIQRIDLGMKLGPDVVVTAAGERPIAGRAFHVGLEPHSVTAGDVWLLDRSRGVLVAGDLVTLPAPFLDTACPAKWKASLDRLAGIGFDVLIPGHGAPLTRTQFLVYRDAFAALLSCAAGAAGKQSCIEGWVAAVAPLHDTDEKFTRALMDYYVDLLRGGTLACPTAAG